MAVTEFNEHGMEGGNAAGARKGGFGKKGGPGIAILKPEWYEVRRGSRETAQEAREASTMQIYTGKLLSADIMMCTLKQKHKNYLSYMRNFPAVRESKGTQNRWGLTFRAQS